MYVCMYVCMYSVYKVDYRERTAPKIDNKKYVNSV